MASSSTKYKMTLKLLIDTKLEKVVFAEASKLVIDFLFSLLSLPVGTVVGLLGSKSGTVGSLDNLYQSVTNLNETYLQENLDKNVLLKPKAPIFSTEIFGLLPLNACNEDAVDNNLEASFHKCNACQSYVECDNRNRFRRIQRSMYSGFGLSYDYVQISKPAVKKNSVKNGFVKETVTFMVMDDLVIQPMSTISSITLLNKLNIKDISALQEKEVEFGMAEVCHVHN